MVQYLNWRWIFYTVVPVELAAFLFALTRLKGEWADARGERFDWLGSIIYIISLASIIVGIVETHNFIYAKWFAIGGTVGMVLFIFYELKNSSPLIPIVDIVTNRIFLFRC